jgi:hypothetical protein
MDAMDRIRKIGSLLGLKTSPLLLRLAPLGDACGRQLAVSIPHSFDTLSVSTRVPRAVAATLCGPWLEQLPGDELELELDGDTAITASSDEAALPADAPAVIADLGGELAAIKYDGTTWTYVVDQPNDDEAAMEATVARFLRVATTAGTTEAQRRIAANLHRSLARGMTSRAWVRASRGELAPVLGLAWDAVEWRPIQSMLGGFYPRLPGVDKIARLSRSVELDGATVELILGTEDPPAMRVTLRWAATASART